MFKGLYNYETKSARKCCDWSKATNLREVRDEENKVMRLRSALNNAKSNNHRANEETESLRFY